MIATALSLPVVLPEFLLAGGLLALVLVGALRGDRSFWFVTECAVALLGLTRTMMITICWMKKKCWRTDITIIIMITHRKM